MGLASALSTALTGLNAAETTIDVVGNNVSNSNTVGFKASEAVFATQFLQTQSLGSSPNATSGGTNPRQIALGTKVAEITPDFTQGTIELSSNPSDLAIQGDGFFIVEGTEGDILYTRNGLFKTNSANELVTVSGQRLLGYGIDENFQIQTDALVPLEIPLGAKAVAQATQNVFFEGTLPPTGDIGDTPAIIESAVLSDGSLEVPPNLSVSDITGVAPPNVTASNAAVDATAGTIDAGTYNYRITFVDADGNEGPTSLDIGPVTAAVGGQSLELTGLPPADGTTFVSRNIYRTDSSGTGDYQFVGNINDSDVSYLDSTGDAFLPGGTLDESTLEQANYAYYVSFYNTASGLESRPTALIGPEPITVDGRKIRLSDIPQPTSGDFDSVRIYRNLASNDSEFYRVATLTGGETSYIDGASDADIEVTGNEINLDGPAINPALRLLDVVRRDGSTYENVFEEGTLSFSGKKGGRRLEAQELEITATTTVQDLINFMEQATGIQEPSGLSEGDIPGNPGGSITADSRISLVSNMGTESALDIGLSAFQLETSGGTLENITLPFSETQEANGESAVADFVVYDTLGIPLNVRVTVVLESKSSASTTYRWMADSPDNDPIDGVETAVGTGLITFDGEGNFISTNNSTVSIDRRNVSSASPLEFDLDFAKLSGLAAEQASLAASRQDGSAPGTLSSFLIGEDGNIRGVFTNGDTQDLGQIRLARFTNNAGLEQRGDNLFAEGVNSGLPVFGDPGQQGTGTIIAGAVELSNTDIGQNLIDLILASTQYRGGTRVITSVQQLFDELLALRR